MGKDGDIMPIIDEASMSVNDFNEPRMYSNAEGLMLLLSRLVLLEPGTFQYHPDMGVGLLTNFRYRLDTDDGLAAELRQRIRSQIDTYLPILTGIDIQVRIVDHTFYVTAEINGNVFAILYDAQANSVVTRYSTIDEL